MILSLEKNMLAEYVAKQLNFFCPDAKNVGAEQILPYINEALERYNECFFYCKLDGYHKDKEVYFDHLHTDKYVTFLYFLSNTMWKSGGDISVCSKIMNAIRIISGMFLSFKCELPKHFIIFHAVGAVIGNAKYGDYLMISQNCTINTGSRPNEVPIIGNGVYLGAGAQIIGDKKIGNHVSIGAGTQVYNREVPDNSVVILDNGVSVVRPRTKTQCMMQNYWEIEI